MTATIDPDWDDIFMSAALKPDRWLDALGQIADHSRSSHGQLIGIGGARDIPFNIVTDFDADDLAAFVAMDGGSSDINFRIAANDRAMADGRYDVILDERDYDAVRPSLRSTTYSDWCETVGIPFGCQTNLVADRVGLVGFAVLRDRRDGVTTADDRRVFARAAGAARRAVRLQERIEGQQADLLAGAFDALAATAFILDARGRVLAMTQTAEGLVSAGIVRLVERRIDAIGTPVSLGQAVATLVDESGLPHVRLRLDGASSHQPVFMEGFRLPTRRWSFGALPHAIVIAKPPLRDRAGVGALLGAIYRLTAAEGDIAIRLFDGASRDDIMQARGVTAETLRGQIKTIYAKTGTQREAELMRLLAGIMG